MVEINNQTQPLINQNAVNTMPVVPSENQEQELPPGPNAPIPTALKAPEKEPAITQFTRTAVSVAELAAATPLVLTSLLNQANNITKFGANKGDDGTVGFFTSIIDTLSLPVRTLVNRFVVQSDDPNDVKHNKRSFFFDDIYQRLLHPNIAKEFTSFLFTFRRAVFNFFPNIFTVPSEDHDPENPDGKVASRATTSFLKTLSTLTSPIRFFTSIAGLGLLSPAKLLSTISAYTGNQKLYDASKEISSVAEHLNPIIANLSSTFSTAKAYWDSFNKKETTLVTFGKYNLTSLNLIQGVLGSVLSIPQFFGSLAKIKHDLLRRDDNNNYHFVNQVKTIVGEFGPKLKALNILTNYTVASMQDSVEKFLTKQIDTTGEYLSNFLHDVLNSSKLTQNLFSRIRPKDITGNVLVSANATAISSQDSNQYFAGTIKKSRFFGELYDLVQPLQSMLMLLPNAFVPVGDPYITDNAIRPLRILDRLLGVNSMILSVPNYIVYGLSSRIPQMILKYFEMKQRNADDKGIKYSAHQNLNKFIESLRKAPMFGASYLANSLESLNVDGFIFKDSEEMDKIYSHLENLAKDQESSVKASELVTAMRIGIRTLLNHKLLHAERDDETGLTAEETSRQKIYKSLGTFKEGVARIPVLGWIAAPFLEIIRGMYKVDVKKNRKRLPGISNQMNKAMAQNNETQANPLAALANLARNPQTN